MSSLKDKNIIVTGASGGIGNAIVQKFYENGALNKILYNKGSNYKSCL